MDRQPDSILAEESIDRQERGGGSSGPSPAGRGRSRRVVDAAELLESGQVEPKVGLLGLTVALAADNFHGSQVEGCRPALLVAADNQVTRPTSATGSNSSAAPSMNAVSHSGRMSRLARLERSDRSVEEDPWQKGANISQLQSPDAVPSRPLARGHSRYRETPGPGPVERDQSPQSPRSPFIRRGVYRPCQRGAVPPVGRVAARGVCHERRALVILPPPRGESSPSRNPYSRHRVRAVPGHDQKSSVFRYVFKKLLERRFSVVLALCI